MTSYSNIPAALEGAVELELDLALVEHETEDEETKVYDIGTLMSLFPYFEDE